MRIGLTGGIASGKSTVSRMIRDRQIPVVDADIAARRVVEPGQPALQHIVKTFGEEILTPEGTLNRKVLGQRIFSNEEERLQLNAIVHPAVRRYMLEQVQAYEEQGHATVVLDIPLLFESKLTDWVQKVLVVYVPDSIQLDRLMKRDHLTKEEAEQRIHAQLSLEKKRDKADAWIDNSHTIAETEKQLDAILHQWIKA
ncbi:dephospho-CoA kinase [Pullulanibacillus pueri]|uniref:Dephospho-CoA kinase n=1 Tax=Pullulanibacillus pueri TaxID=1437324 RepID=A0A8J3EN47_9BACL|nr:dephospho-CoA kinase [Pullulanibacillus pueri]MBM7683468.1 dephospho-CoA kinase [Pullulanibacillus pueri]GGH86781.1 dephospho-CoA kinase [Pullulanibacillus pueri]